MKFLLTVKEKGNEKAKPVTIRKGADINELRNIGKDFTRFNLVQIFNAKRELIEVVK